MIARHTLAACSLLAILLLVLLGTLTPGNRVRAASFASIVVHSHGFAKQITYTKGHVIPTNQTDSFTEDDEFAYAYFTATVSSANVTWLWYEPGGRLFVNRTQEISCDSSPCTFVYYFPLRYTNAATKFGTWTLTLEAGGVDLYSDHFSVIPVVNQVNSWSFDVIQSAPPRVHVYLTVTIYPQNGTWGSYLISLPFATNVTAYDLSTNHTLEVNLSNSTGQIVVDLGVSRADGYTFVVSFDLKDVVWSMGGWNSGYFAIRWQESTWATFHDGYHPVPGSFEIMLPQGSSFLDAVGINAIALNQNITTGLRPTVSFATTLPPTQSFGWVILYRDLTYPNTNAPSIHNLEESGLNVAQTQPIPILPLTIGSFSIWSAAMSVLLLTGSELLSPVYARTGVVINRRRLRMVAVILVVLFLAASVYQVIAISQPVSLAGH